MNKEKIVMNMITFIEDKEREVQSNKMISVNQAKNDVVKSILTKLEKEIENENKENRI